MDLRDLPTTERDKVRQCFCGCDLFRFKLNDNKIDEEQTLFYNLCRNCNHSLGSHVVIVRSKQAE